MEVIKRNNKYRLIYTKYKCIKDFNCYLPNFKVQVKFIYFWITIKEFKVGVYDDDFTFCRNEAIELYNKIVNPYG